jgi:predicted alpha/beta hydrolase
MEYQVEEHFLETADNNRLFVARFCPANTPIAAVLLIHGSIENGRIFYSKSGKGLAPFLAKAGYEVWVPDLRGRGKSSPVISRNAGFGNDEIIRQDLPHYTEWIATHSKGLPLVWIGHSWGGVLLMSMLARGLQAQSPVALVTFGTKRRISIGGWKKWYMIDFFWVFVSRLLKALYGYLPAAALGMGSDNETIRSHNETHHLVVHKEWIDPVDGFHYARSLSDQQIPPSLWITGSKDDVLGHPTDVKAFIHECHAKDATFWLAGRSEGFACDYDHINLLTHPIAAEDVFPRVLVWIGKHLSKSV